MKKFSTVCLILILALLAGMFSGCGGSDSGSGDSGSIEGELTDIMAELNKAVDSENFVTFEIEPENYNYELYIDYIEGAEAIYSGPMITAKPYCSYLLRLPDGADVESVAETIRQNADPRKWICVEADKVVVDTCGDLILFAMADTESADALSAAFDTLASGGTVEARMAVRSVEDVNDEPTAEPSVEPTEEPEPTDNHGIEPPKVDEPEPHDSNRSDSDESYTTRTPKPTDTPKPSDTPNPSDEPSDTPTDSTDETAAPDESSDVETGAEPAESPSVPPIFMPGSRPEGDDETEAAPVESIGSLSGSLEDIMSELNAAIASDGFVTMAVAPENYGYDLGIDYIEGAEAVYCGPAIGSTPYCSYLLRVPDGTDAAAVAGEIGQNANLNRWFCVSAEKAAVRRSGNIILFVMADTARTDALAAAFETLATGGTVTPVSGEGTEPDSGDAAADLASMSLSDIMLKIHEGRNTDMLVMMQVAPENYGYELGIDYIAGAEAIYYGPEISGDPYCAYLLRLPEGVDAEAVAAQIESAADLNRWVCVSAEKAAVRTSGSVIFFVMADASTVDALTANFDALADGGAD